MPVCVDSSEVEGREEALLLKEKLKLPGRNPGRGSLPKGFAEEKAGVLSEEVRFRVTLGNSCQEGFTG